MSVDFYIKGVPFDLKSTKFPSSVKNFSSEYDFIFWLYENQSKESRLHFRNRLFLIFNGTSPLNTLELRIDIERIEEEVKIFFQDLSKNGFKNFELSNGDVVNSAIIEIK